MSKDPRSYLQRAEDHRRHGRLKEAIAACREALQEHPALDAARITLGRALLESGEAAAAAETLAEVFARLPEHHLAGRTLAEAQRRLGDFDAAAATCRALLEHYPRDREIEPLLATILEEKGAGGEKPAEPVAAKAAPKPAAPQAPPVAPAPPKAAAAPAPSPIAVAAPDPEPEYSPEDVEVSSPMRLVNVGQAAPEPVKTPERKPEPARAPRSDGDALATNTLAELYVRQGMTERAVAVYRNMLRVEPGNAAVRRRLAEIEGKEEAAGVVVAARAAVPVVLPPPSEVIPASVATAPKRAIAPAPVPMPVAVAPEPPPAARGLAPADKAAVARLERWLDAIRKDSAAGAES